MAARPYRTLEDLERTVRALAIEFDTDKVIIIGSQAILVEWPEAPTDMTAHPRLMHILVMPNDGRRSTLTSKRPNI